MNKKFYFPSDILAQSKKLEDARLALKFAKTKEEAARLLRLIKSADATLQKMMKGK